MTVLTVLKKLSMMTFGAALIALGSVGSAEAATIVQGSIIKPDEQTTTVDYWDFTVNTASQVTMNVLAYSIDFGNGFSGLDSYLHLFNDDGSLDVSDWITSNDDNFSADALSDGSISGLDSYLSLFLNPGQYKLAISDFYFSQEQAVAGIQTSFNPMGGSNGDYQITFTGDVTLASVPEPTSMLGLLAFSALGAGSMLKRKQQNNP